jgi:hypothetical protein
LDTLTLAFALHLIILGYTLGFDFVVDQRTFLKARSSCRGRLRRLRDAANPLRPNRHRNGNRPPKRAMRVTIFVAALGLGQLACRKDSSRVTHM